MDALVKAETSAMEEEFVGPIMLAGWTHFGEQMGDVVVESMALIGANSIAVEWGLVGDLQQQQQQD